jgi:Fur family peroxide stress response transcriptional regulator
MHHGSLRVEMNDESHHHLMCSKCIGITGIGEKELGLVLKEEKLPGGFLVERYAVDVIGICPRCQQT